MLLYNEHIFKREFCWSKKYWYRNILSILRYFKSLHYLIKHGYDKSAVWDTFSWFIDTMRSILQEYNTIHSSHPYRYTEEEWNAIINRMLELLDDMDENSPKYEEKEYYLNWAKQRQEMFAAKEEFFKLFAENFYDLWD